MLFGHDLQDRLQKGEEIFFFCFYVLKYLMDDEFSIAGQRYNCNRYFFLSHIFTYNFIAKIAHLDLEAANKVAVEVVQLV